MARCLLAGLCALAACTIVCPIAGLGRRTTLRLLYSIPVPGEFVAVLEDVNPGAIAILNGTGGTYAGRTEPSPDYDRPKLLLWNIPERKLLREVPLGECVKRRAELPPHLRALRLGPFRFVDNGAKVVGIQLPWLFSIDAVTGAENSPLLLSPGLLKAASPYLQSLGPPLEASPSGRLVATVADQGATAAKPRLVVLHADPLTIVADAPLRHCVEALAWSPDNARIAVLYTLFFDENGGPVPWGRMDSARRQPDVEIFDAQSGRSLLSFRTGADQSGICFSHDGKTLWCVATPAEAEGLVMTLAVRLLATLSRAPMPSRVRWSQDVMRVFSSADGSLVRTIQGGSTGFRGNLVISPSGRFAVADASEIVPYHVAEPPTDQKIGAFTFLDAATGRVLFKYHKRMTGDYGASYRFAFTKDERFLLVDSNNFHNGPGPRLEERVDVYAID